MNFSTRAEAFSLLNHPRFIYSMALTGLGGFRKTVGQLMPAAAADFGLKKNLGPAIMD